MKWKWSSDDENIKYYRWQLDGEDDNGWTVVDSSVTTIHLLADNNSVLYIQASYDGARWSESGYATYVATEAKLECTLRGDKVVWTWNNEDENVLFFRYQRDGEKEGGWTILNASTTKISLPYHEGDNWLYLQESYDGANWSESYVGVYQTNTRELKVSVEEFIKDEEYGESKSSPFALEEVEMEDPALLSYRWSNAEGYNWFEFRVNDEPWYLVDKHTSGAVLRLYEGLEKDDVIFQLRASFDGENWTERLRTNDSRNIYNEDYLDREGWIVFSSVSVTKPYFVAFFTPGKGTINYTTPRELTTESLKVSFSGDITAQYETKNGHGFGLRVREIYTPTDKGDPFSVTSIEVTYSNLLLRTRRYDTFQLWLDAGLGPSLCLFQNTGALGFSVSLGISGRFKVAENLLLSVSYENTAVIEPNFNEKDQLALATTLYTSLPVRVGLIYSFKEVRD